MRVFLDTPVWRPACGRVSRNTPCGVFPAYSQANINMIINIVTRREYPVVAKDWFLRLGWYDVQISDSLIWNHNEEIKKCYGQTDWLTQWPFLRLLSQLKTNVSKIFLFKCEMWWSPSSRWWEGRSGHTGNTHASHAPVSWDYIVLHYIIIDYITL